MNKLLPLISWLCKALAITMPIIATNNWNALASPSGRDLIQTLLWTGIPALVAGVGAVGFTLIDRSEKKAALMADPPLAKTDEFDGVQINKGGVNLTLRVKRTPPADEALCGSIVEMVKATLAVKSGATEAPSK